MTPEEAARQFATARPGYRLIAYRAVALPLFKVDLELLILERKDVPPLQEFVLRSVDAGLTGLNDVAGLLGLDEGVARAVIAELLSSENLVLVGGAEGGRRHRLALTRRGRATAAEAESVQPVEVTLPVWVDGLTRQIISAKGRGQWFPAGRAGDRGLVEIAASPRRRPGLEELPLEAVQAVIRAESAGRRARREVVGITGLGKARRYSREAVALAYTAAGEDDLLISLVVDGQVSDQHDAAFARVLERSARRVVPDDWHSAERLRETVVEAELLSQAVDERRTEQIEHERRDLRDEDHRLRRAAESAAPDELRSLRERLAESERRQGELQAALDSISVRQVPVYDHPEYLRRALVDATKRVMIISPWIRHEVVNDEFITRLRKTLERGISVWIGYGITPEGGYRPKAKGERDRDAERKLRGLEKDHPELFHMTRLGDTHAKVLVCDSRFSIITSFNWLSFRGDDTLEFRDERGYYVGLSGKVDEVFDSYRDRFPDS